MSGKANGHAVKFQDDARENYLEACHHYLFLAFRGAKPAQLIAAAATIWEARNAYVK